MNVTLNDWTIGALGEIAKHPKLSLTAKGLALAINCSGPVPDFNPDGRSQSDRGYMELITYGYAHAK